MRIFENDCENWIRFGWIRIKCKSDNSSIALIPGLITLQSGSNSATYTTNNISLSGDAKISASILRAKVNNYFIVMNNDGEEIIAFGDQGIFPHRTINMQGENIINAGNVSSDRRLKKDIQTSNISAIDRIMAIQHHAFTWKKDNQKEEIGYIAQELEEIDPNYVRHNVTKDEQGNIISDMYEVRILPLLSTATKAIKEQHEIIKKQQKTIEELTNRIEKLESDEKG